MPAVIAAIDELTQMAEPTTEANMPHKVMAADGFMVVMEFPL
jgi:hypothetical protein